MKFVNETDVVADLFRGELRPGWMHGSLVARVRYRITPDGQLHAPEDDDVLTDIRRDREEDAYGMIIEPDVPFPRVATDLIVLADACPPKRSSAVATKVRVKVGPYDHELLVVGDRIWERGLTGDLAASRPEPFTAMPLSWTNAFGGKAKSQYGEVPYGANPVGKGYYLDAASAVGGPLPNIEDPAHPVAKWQDHPDPVGIGPYPAEWMLRLRDVVEVREGRGDFVIHPDKGMFDRAHPWFSGKPVNAGDPIEITNTTFAERLCITVPACPIEMELRLGEDRWVRPLELEEILLDLRKGLCDLTYRKMCKYPFVEHQKRCTTLRPVSQS